jgi:anaerobic selenocysteine-containing dehydrogenase
MADDILRQGPGQVRFLLNLGGNPGNCVPDQRKMVRALKSLELLVSVEPFMTPTAKLSHYILPPRMFYERADLPMHIFEQVLYPRPYTRYTPQIAPPPADSELCSEWDLLWQLARRLGKQLSFHGVALDMDTPPDDDAMLAIVARKALLPWEAIKSEPLGCFHDPGTVALPRDPATASQFTTLPDDVRQEVADLLADVPTPGEFRSNGQTFSFLTSSRRQRHRFNSFGFKISKLQRAMPYNYGYMNPADMAVTGIADGDWIAITSDHGTIRVLAQEDAAMRRGVVSICHGFGGLPDEDDFLIDGVSPNQLISTDRNLQTINGQPRMSGIPVNVRRAAAPAAAAARETA